MLILILIDVQYSRNTAFNFEKGLNCQNHSSSGSHHPVKKFPSNKISDSSPHWVGEFTPQPLTAIWKTLVTYVRRS